MLSLHILCTALVDHLISGFLNLEVGFQVVLGLFMYQLLSFPLGCFATSNPGVYRYVFSSIYLWLTAKC